MCLAMFHGMRASGSVGSGVLAALGATGRSNADQGGNAFGGVT
jgi:hypothetical protein